jgi:hypothetical protein
VIESNSVADRTQFVRIQARIDSELHGGSPPPVLRVSKLPRPAAPSTLAILGDCVALYQSDGRNWFELEGVQRTGSFALSMNPRYTGGLAYQPLIEIGSSVRGQEVAMQWMSSHTARFSYRPLGMGQAWADGSVVELSPGQPHPVIVTFDDRQHSVSVVVDGVTVLALADIRFELSPTTTGQVHIGGTGPDHSAPSRFNGTLSLDRSETPLCTTLLRGG